MNAIAAMARNRVIGHRGAMPWHLPEDFRWFKQTTLGGVVLMGRKTFASIGRPLPGRLNLVVTRHPLPSNTHPDVQPIHDLAAFRPQDYAPREVWVAGGAEIYAALLPRCAQLFLTLLDRDAEGDTFFPPFESDFQFAETVLEKPGFTVQRFVNRHLPPPPILPEA